MCRFNIPMHVQSSLVGSRLRIQRHHYSGSGHYCGTGTSTCHGCSQKKKKKKKKDSWAHPRIDIQQVIRSRSDGGGGRLNSVRGFLGCMRDTHFTVKEKEEGRMEQMQESMLVCWQDVWLGFSQRKWELSPPGGGSFCCVQSFLYSCVGNVAERRRKQKLHWSLVEAGRYRLRDCGPSHSRT